MTQFRPLQQLMTRVDAHGSDSDSTLFSELLYAGEFIVKATTAAMVALVQNDREGHQYRLLHTLVRADGIGEWAAVLDETLTGPASQHLLSETLEVRRTFTERSTVGSWQNQAVKELSAVLSGLVPDSTLPSDRPQLRTWFQIFAELRNKTRGHGAMTPAMASRLVGHFRSSIEIIGVNNPVFQLPWAYLHRNLSGKYRVVSLGGNEQAFSDLKSAKAVDSENYAPGVYLYSRGLRRVELLHTDVDASDFFVPNGAFRNSTYELHSLISDNRLRGDATPYLFPATERPASETEGRGALDIVGNVFTNLPPCTPGYVRRPKLEAEIAGAFTNDRHPVITLVGRGGIGKTSAALTVLHDIARQDRFDLVIWFSARDIDLTLSGAKPVKPQVLTESEIAKEYVRLVGYEDEVSKERPATKVLSEHLTSNPIGPTLFVFDNFETARNPIDLFNWIDANIRLPNKAIITSRFRDFKADYPITVGGMETSEAEELVRKTSVSLCINGLLGPSESQELIEESDGHPYIIKILLGDIADAGRYSKPARLIARKDDILDALFERTYASLNPAAERAFLILCSWRSLVPQLALEAALLRHAQEGIDPEAAIDRLVRTSLIERLTAPDGSDFLEVPLTAATFGKRKLEVSPIRATIDNDVRFLQDVGATSATNLKEGLAPKIESLFRRVARKGVADPKTLDEVRPVLEFLANHYTRAWLMLADLDQELGRSELATDSLRKFLASQPSPNLAQKAWQQLVGLYRKSNSVLAACDAFTRASTLAEPPFAEVSAMANWLNQSPEAWTGLHTTERRTIFSPLARLMEDGLNEANATDLSRLSWLYLHIGNEKRALQLADMGLEREPSNTYCQRLVEKLTVAR